MSADAGLFGPGSVTWRVHADHSMIVGGLRALLLQALHPLAMAGVAEHGDFHRDPWGRLRRTARYVMTTTFGDMAAAEAAGAQVRAIHTRVRGTDPYTGRPYRADDPELLAWVHNVEVDSFLAAYRRYGGRLSGPDGDRYVAEMARAARLVGLDPAAVPHDVAHLRAVLSGATLVATPLTDEARRTLLAPDVPLRARPLWGLLAAATVALLPERARRAYGLPWFPPAEPAVRLATTGLVAAMNLALPGPAPEARARRAA